MKQFWFLSIFFLIVLSGLLIRTDALMQDNGMIADDGRVKAEFTRAPASLQCRNLQSPCQNNKECCSRSCLDNKCQKTSSRAKLNGQKCNVDSDCLSSTCSNLKLCAPSPVHQSEAGEFCLSHSGCKSNTCDSRTRECRGPAQVKD